MDRFTPLQCGTTANSIAAEWHSVAARCNIEPSSIMARLPGGATPMDCSHMLICMLRDRAFSIRTFVSALRQCGLNRQAESVAKMGDDGTRTEGAILVRVHDYLTVSDKQNILLQAGVPAGTASTVAQGGVAEFWAAVKNRVSIDTTEQLARLFASMPAIVRMIEGSSMQEDDQPLVKAGGGGGGGSNSFGKRLADAESAAQASAKRKVADNLVARMVATQHPDWMLVATILNKQWVENGTRERKYGWELLLILLAERMPALAQTLSAMRVHYRSAASDKSANVALSVLNELDKTASFAFKDWHEFVFRDLAAVNSAPMAREIVDKVGSRIDEREADDSVASRQAVDADDKFNMLTFIALNKEWLKKGVTPEEACRLLADEGGANTLAELNELNEQDVSECGFHKRGAKLLLANVAAQMVPHAPDED